MNIINFVLFGAFLNLLFSRLHGKTNVLCCGLFGFIAKENKKINQRQYLRNVLTLGVYNIQRGVDSCGYYWSGNILKGVDFNKNFGDFIVNKPLVKGALPHDVFIGHTRKATGGVHDEVNGHPHMVDDMYVQTHNGVIRNPMALCQKFEIEDGSRIGIDSMVLAHIIKNKGYDVLNYYEGYAALAFTYKNEPDVMYLYHGESFDKATDKDPTEERPLFTLDMPEGLYYSSLYNSLKFIAEGKATPVELPHNQIIKIERGKIIGSVYDVKREQANLTPLAYKKTVNLFSPDYRDLLRAKHAKGKGAKIIPINRTDEPAIWQESLPLEYDATKPTKVYYRYGRFHRGPNVLLNGKYNISRDGVIYIDPQKSERLTEEYWFIRGAMLNNGERDYNALIKTHPNIITEDQDNLSFYLSKYSRYPVCCLPEEGERIAGTFRSMWFEKGKKAKNVSFRPKFAMRTYNIDEQGLLATIRPAFNGENVWLGTGVIGTSSILEGCAAPPTVEVRGFVVNEQGTLFEHSDTPAHSSGLFERKSTKNGITCIDLRNYGTPMDDGVSYDEGQDVIQRHILDQVTYDSMCGMVKQYWDAPLDRNRMSQLPEQFLMFTDYVIARIHEREKGIKQIAEGKLEQLTTDFLDDAIQNNWTFREALNQEDYASEFLTQAHVSKCFEAFEIDELARMENRYYFIEFQPTPDEADGDDDTSLLKTINEYINDIPSAAGRAAAAQALADQFGVPVEDIEYVDSDAIEDQGLEVDAVMNYNKNREVSERCHLLLDQLRDLIKSADNFQGIDTESSQELAFTLYQEVDMLKARIGQTAEQYKFNDIVAELAAIK